MFPGNKKNANDSKDPDESDLKFVRFENEKLRADVDRLNRIVEAMWDLLKTETRLDEAMLSARMKELKERGDPEPDLCMICERPLPLHSNRCIYCNTVIDSDRVF